MHTQGLLITEKGGIAFTLQNKKFCHSGDYIGMVDLCQAGEMLTTASSVSRSSHNTVSFFL